MRYRDLTNAPNTRLIEADEVYNNIAKIIQQFPQVTHAMLLNVAKAVRNEARQVVPVKSGHLRQSIRYKREPDGSYTVYANTRWGDVNRHYAVTVHEDLKAGHKSGKMAKYIERPFVRMAGGPMAEMIAQQLLLRLAQGMSVAGAWKVTKDLIDYSDFSEE